jgi:hypothetical protein
MAGADDGTEESETDGAGGSSILGSECSAGSAIIPECESVDGVWFPNVSMPSAQGIMILSTEQYGGGFQAFASKRGSSLVAQLWSTTPGEGDWTQWLCLDSLPEPDRMAGHSLLDGTLEVFATTTCGDLYRRVVDSGGWLPWTPFGLPAVGQAVTDVAVSETADDTDVVYVADRGHIFARPRLGSERTSPYGAWREILGASNAARVSGGLRSDRRQQVFMIDTSGAVLTAVQKNSALDSPFGDWSDFDSSQLSAPLVDIEAPLGGALPLEVYAVSSDGTLWQRTQNDDTGAFEPWRKWAGPSTPGALLSVSGAGLKLVSGSPLRLMVLTKTRHVYTIRRTADLWDDWRWFP